MGEFIVVFALVSLMNKYGFVKKVNYLKPLSEELHGIVKVTFSNL
jgi:hypothetical protein